MTPRLLALLLLAGLAAFVPAAGATPGHRFARSVAHDGPRPAGSAGERRAHARIRRVFERAGLRVDVDGFRVPGRGRSRNVIGIRDTPASCLLVLMAHADTVAGSPGALDNASGLGALVDLAPRLRGSRCDVWLVATGAEERIYTGRRDHMGATALARRVRRQRRGGDLRLALSLDEVGAGRRLRLRSSARAPRRRIERAVVRAARGSGLRVDWLRDAGGGNSDHREFQIRGLPAAKLGMTDNPWRHGPRDTARRLDRGTFVRLRRLLVRLAAAG